VAIREAVLSTICFARGYPSRPTVAAVIATATRGLAAGLLLLAAAQEWIESLSPVTLPGRAGLGRWSWLLLAAFEAFWALWLLGGVRPRLTRWASVALFAVFGAIAAYHGVLGHGSCGCFGRIQVNPWLTCTIDLGLAIAFLSIGRDPASTPTSPRRALERVAIIATIYAAIVVPAAFLVRSRSIAADASSGSARPVLLEPASWKGKLFPLVAQIDIGARLMNGKWMLLFYRPGCPKCDDAIRRVRESAQRGGEPPEVQWAFIELPPLEASRPAARAELPANSILGRLDPTATWIGDVPFVITLSDGKVY
jgi:hypothetical protein